MYDEGRRRVGDLALEDACEAGQEDGAFSWIDLYEPTPGEFDALQREFSLHPLAVEDALEAHERPKLERYGETALIVLRTAHYDDEREDIDFGEILLFSGDGFVITVRHGAANDLDEIRAKLEGEPDRLARGGAAVLHAVVDKVVDDYEPVVHGLQNDIDEVEEALFGADGGGASTKRIYRLGREVIEFSRAVQPLVEPVRRLARGDVVGDDEDLRRYFRDVQDHIERVDNWVAAQRDLLANLLQANLTQVTIVQNGDMRKISAWVAIVAVPTMIAGIYGMNFEHMPELKSELGYPAVMTVIVVACVFLYTRFKRSGWL